MSFNDFEEHMDSLRRAYLQKSRRSKDGVNLTADLMLRGEVRDEGEPESGGATSTRLAKSVKVGINPKGLLPGGVGIDPKGVDIIEDGARLSFDLNLSCFQGFDLIEERSYNKEKRVDGCILA